VSRDGLVGLAIGMHLQFKHAAHVALGGTKFAPAIGAIMTARLDPAFAVTAVTRHRGDLAVGAEASRQELVIAFGADPHG
jgi:hypothetical protein